MLTTKNLERVIALEDKLRTEYQTQLDAKSTEIEQGINKQQEQQAIIDKQLEKIATLSTEATANKRIEQLNRELTQRSENLQEEVTKQKKRLKALQKDLAEERAEVKALKQFDPAKMKKNLDATKKKLAEKSTASDLLQKSLNKSRAENAELQRKLKEFEARLAELETTEEVEKAAA
jgi:DNA repair exonuclease SbcCD ATPase subunit